MKRKRLSNEEFVTAWQRAETLADAAKAAGVSPRQASHRAYYLRKVVNVDLKVFQEPGQRIDREGLRELARRLSK